MTANSVRWMDTRVGRGLIGTKNKRAVPIKSGPANGRFGGTFCGGTGFGPPPQPFPSPPCKTDELCATCQTPISEQSRRKWMDTTYVQCEKWRQLPARQPIGERGAIDLYDGCSSVRHIDLRWRDRHKVDARTWSHIVPESGIFCGTGSPIELRCTKCPFQESPVCMI
jgi:hypothetical protein